MTRFRIPLRLLALAIPAFVAACSGDNNEAQLQTAADSAAAVDLERWKSAQKLADSVLSSAPTLAQIRKEVGESMYSIADDSLTAAVLREAEKTRFCYTNALRDQDPRLSGTVYMLVNLGGAGWDLVRPERSVWSSPMGGAVNTCLLANAKSTWKLPIKGVKPGAHLVQLTFRPDSTPPTPGTPTRKSY